MKSFDIQSVELDTDFEKAFQFISNPANLPLWTSAFREADNKSAILVTPNGELSIGLSTVTSGAGTIDWYMQMPDGSIGKAYSRLTELPNGKILYSFILLAPPVPIELVEGTLEEQKKLLANELLKLKETLN